MEIELGPFNLVGVTDYTTATFRKQFLDAVRESTPEALDSLRADVWPKYAEVRKHISELHLPEDREITALTYLKSRVLAGRARQMLQLASIDQLTEALDRWAISFRLNVQWILDASLETLGYWYERQSETTDLGWHHPDLPTQTCLSLSEEFFEYRIASRFDPYRESPHEFKRQVLKEVEERVDEHVRKVEALLEQRGVEPRHSKRNREHFNWLALRLVRRLTFSQIADQVSQKRGPDEDVGVDTIRKGVKAALKLLNTRPEPRSEPFFLDLPIPPVTKQ